MKYFKQNTIFWGSSNVEMAHQGSCPSIVQYTSYFFHLWPELKGDSDVSSKFMSELLV
jgi:hypothetical protein